MGHGLFLDNAEIRLSIRFILQRRAGLSIILLQLPNRFDFMYIQIDPKRM
jgi:hypothetical protein